MVGGSPGTCRFLRSFRARGGEAKRLKRAGLLSGELAVELHKKPYVSNPTLNGQPIEKAYRIMLDIDARTGRTCAAIYFYETDDNGSLKSTPSKNDALKVRRVFWVDEGSLNMNLRGECFNGSEERVGGFPEANDEPIANSFARQMAIISDAIAETMKQIGISVAEAVDGIRSVMQGIVDWERQTQLVTRSERVARAEASRAFIRGRGRTDPRGK